MSKDRFDRRLAAIVFIDFVGYSRMMAANEAGTLLAIEQRWRDVIAPILEVHDGTVIKQMGDGALLEFHSALEAVEAAIDVQTRSKLANHNAGEAQLELRIGINVGDVIGRDSDIFGDGVNIAARLQQLAPPNGIVISGNVHEQVKGKLAAQCIDMGFQKLKNIGTQVRAYAVGAGEKLRDLTVPIVDERPSIAVLPFKNLTEEQDAFARGITDNIVNGLARFRDIAVIYSVSTSRYADQAIDFDKVSRELNARYLLQGTVQGTGDRVRISAHMTDAFSRRTVWSERYDRARGDIFDLQDEITELIVSTLASSHGGRLRKAWQERPQISGTRSLTALDFFLRGMDVLNHFTKEGNAEARRLFQQAMETDPRYAKPIAKISWSHMIDAYCGWSEDPAASWSDALRFAEEAVACDSDESWGHFALAGYWMYKRKHELSIDEFHSALRLNPNEADILNDLGLCLSYAGEPELGIEHARRAIRLNPHHPEYYYTQLGQIAFDARRYAEAVAVLGKVRQSGAALAHAYLAASYAASDRMEEAARAVEQILRLDPDATVAKWANPENAPYKLEQDLEHFQVNLLKAGLVSG